MNGDGTFGTIDFQCLMDANGPADALAFATMAAGVIDIGLDKGHGEGMDVYNPASRNTDADQASLYEVSPNILGTPPETFDGHLSVSPMQGGRPRMSFSRQPPSRFRFRYLSDKGSHGSLKATLQLHDMWSQVKVLVSLYTCKGERVPHELLRLHKTGKGKSQGGQRLLSDLEKELEYTVEAKGTTELNLDGLSIYRLTTSDLQINGKDLKSAQSICKDFKEHDTCLRVDVYDMAEHHLIGPLYSNDIKDSRTSTKLKVQRTLLGSTSSSHIRDLWLITEMVKQDDIEVRVCDDLGWEAKCIVDKVYYQHVICCRTPQYPTLAIQERQPIYLYLFRPSDEMAGDKHRINIYLDDDPNTGITSAKRMRPNEQRPIMKPVRHPQTPSTQHQPQISTTQFQYQQLQEFIAQNQQPWISIQPTMNPIKQQPQWPIASVQQQIGVQGLLGSEDRSPTQQVPCSPDLNIPIQDQHVQIFASSSSPGQQVPLNPALSPNGSAGCNGSHTHLDIPSNIDDMAIQLPTSSLGSLELLVFSSDDLLSDGPGSKPSKEKSKDGDESSYKTDDDLECDYYSDTDNNDDLNDDELECDYYSDTDNNDDSSDDELKCDYYSDKETVDDLGNKLEKICINKEINGRDDTETHNKEGKEDGNNEYFSKNLMKTTDVNQFLDRLVKNKRQPKPKEEDMLLKSKSKGEPKQEEEDMLLRSKSKGEEIRNGGVRDKRDNIEEENEERQRESNRATQKMTKEVATSIGEVTTSSGEVTSSTGEVALSNGEVTSSTGEVTTSTGEVTSSTGEVTTSTGEVTSSNGEVTLSTGEVTASTRQVTLSTGEVTVSTGEVTTSTGEVTLSTGKVTTSTGEITTSAEKVATSAQVRTKLNRGANKEVKEITEELEVLAVNPEMSTDGLKHKCERLKASAEKLNLNTSNGSRPASELDQIPQHPYHFQDTHGWLMWIYIIPVVSVAYLLYIILPQIILS